MKCPHCEYSYEEYACICNEVVDVSTGRNPFYRLPVPLERVNMYGKVEGTNAYLYGCPNCTKTFMKGLVENVKIF